MLHGWYFLVIKSWLHRGILCFSKLVSLPASDAAGGQGPLSALVSFLPEQLLWKSNAAQIEFYVGLSCGNVHDPQSKGVLQALTCDTPHTQQKVGAMKQQHQQGLHSSFEPTAP